LAFWEYVLLVEISGHIIERDRGRHLRDHNLFEPYRALEGFLDRIELKFSGSFAERVAGLVQRMIEGFKGKLDGAVDVAIEENEVTGVVYKRAVGQLNGLIFEYLKHKQEVWLLFDNLDKGWSTDGLDKTDLTIVRCLIDACRKLQQRLSRDHVKVHSTLFLRNDVYELMVRSTSDKGKEASVKVDWTDPDLLRQMLRLRLISSGSFDEGTTFEDVWGKIAVSHYRGEETSQYLIERCLMRPRFLIDLVSYCKSSACNLGHEKIEESDIDKGLRNFSNDLVSDLQYEMHDIDPQAEDVIYAFIDSNSRFGEDELAFALDNAGIALSKKERVVEMLLWYGFLGIAQDQDRTTYIYNVNYEMKLLSGLRKRLGSEVKYCVNPAFAPALGVRSTYQVPELF
jgi:hypothetical protein